MRLGLRCYGGTWRGLHRIVLGFLLVILVSSASSTLPALFPTAVRYTGIALDYNFSTVFFAGPSQTIANQLIETTGNQLVPGRYMAIAGVILSGNCCNNGRENCGVGRLSVGTRGLACCLRSAPGRPDV